MAVESMWSSSCAKKILDKVRFVMNQVGILGRVMINVDDSNIVMWSVLPLTR